MAPGGANPLPLPYQQLHRITTIIIVTAITKGDLLLLGPASIAATIIHISVAITIIAIPTITIGDLPGSVSIATTIINTSIVIVILTITIGDLPGSYPSPLPS